VSSITIVSDAPNCGITYERLFDDHNSFIIQAIGVVKLFFDIADDWQNRLARLSLASVFRASVIFEKLSNLGETLGVGQYTIFFFVRLWPYKEL
jgi:hypothetical protein